MFLSSDAGSSYARMINLTTFDKFSFSAAAASSAGLNTFTKRVFMKTFISYSAGFIFVFLYTILFKQAETFEVTQTYWNHRTSQNSSIVLWYCCNRYRKCFVKTYVLIVIILTKLFFTCTWYDCPSVLSTLPLYCCDVIMSLHNFLLCPLLFLLAL